MMQDKIHKVFTVLVQVLIGSDLKEHLRRETHKAERSIAPNVSHAYLLAFPSLV